MDLEKLKQKLSSYPSEKIIIKYHAEIQALVRDIDLEEVKENLRNPKRLVYAEKQESQNPSEKKYNCYFAYSEDFAHRYILTTNGNLIIVTIIRINRNWQKTIKKK